MATAWDGPAPGGRPHPHLIPGTGVELYLTVFSPVWWTSVVLVSVPIGLLSSWVLGRMGPQPPAWSAKPRLFVAHPDPGGWKTGSRRDHPWPRRHRHSPLRGGEPVSVLPGGPRSRLRGRRARISPPRRTAVASPRPERSSSSACQAPCGTVPRIGRLSFEVLRAIASFHPAACPLLLESFPPGSGRPLFVSAIPRSGG